MIAVKFLNFTPLTERVGRQRSLSEEEEISPFETTFAGHLKATGYATRRDPCGQRRKKTKFR
jgi:hypothetical protein